MYSVILTTAFFPPISYFSAIYHSNAVFIEKFENYQRQTIRNRCYIVSSQGIQTLVVPVKKTDDKIVTHIELDYTTPWISKQCQAIRSAYGKTPFFTYFSDELLAPLYAKHRYLFDLNMDILNRCLSILEITNSIRFTEEYKHSYDSITDLRSCSAKKNTPFCKAYQIKSYTQAFSERLPFIADLSILDLIFNVGKEGLLLL